MLILCDFYTPLLWHTGTSTAVTRDRVKGECILELWLIERRCKELSSVKQFKPTNARNFIEGKM